MRLNKAKCRVLHMGQGNSQCQHRLGDGGTDSSPNEKDLGVLKDEKLDMNKPCALAAQKASRTLGCIPSSMASRARDGVLGSARTGLVFTRSQEGTDPGGLTQPGQTEQGILYRVPPCWGPVGS